MYHPARPEAGRVSSQMKGKQVSLSGLATALTNLSIALLYAFLAAAHLANFARHHRPSAILVVVLEGLFAFFVLVRAPADRSSFAPWDSLVTLGGTLTPLLLRPGQAHHDLIAGEVIQVIGTCLAVLGILSLNRSLGLVPAHREIKRAGPYRWVRHPLYCAYTVSNAGYLINNFNVLNLVLVLAALAFQVLRIFSEERFLSQYPSYADYKARTRWRLIPFIY